MLQFYQDEREEAVADPKAVEQNHNELQVGLRII